MTYFPDLAPYAYGNRAHPGVVHVGWLDDIHPFTKGPVDPLLVEKMKMLAATPVELSRGKHLCEVCVEPPDVVKTSKSLVPGGVKVLDLNCTWYKWAAPRMSNGEIRVSSAGITFAAPILIVHYIEEHGYLPPACFLEAVEKA
jgi:hypothetical protein